MEAFLFQNDKIPPNFDEDEEWQKTDEYISYICHKSTFVTMPKYYRHFKGNIYKFLHIAKHSETLEEYVVYQAMYGERGIWIRPKEMFEETIVRDGVEIKRFTEISEEDYRTGNY